MKKKIIILFCIFFVGLILYFFRSDSIEIKQDYHDLTISNSKETKKLTNRTAGNQIFGKPLKLSIPKLEIYTDIESVGMDKYGNMDVPKSSENVAWYQLGFKPGESGNAVLAGHFDNKDGTPAIFWKLGELEVGDRVSVIDEEGNTLTFEVRKLTSYRYENFPIQEVFGTFAKPRLNLITCGGSWDAGNNIYTERLVVYTQLSGS